MSRNLEAGINETKLIEYCLLHRDDICWVAFENVIEMNVVSDSCWRIHFFRVYS